MTHEMPLTATMSEAQVIEIKHRWVIFRPIGPSQPVSAAAAP
jgi:hypothetical protein